MKLKTFSIFFAFNDKILRNHKMISSSHRALISRTPALALALITLLAFSSTLSSAVKSMGNLEFNVGNEYTNVMTLSENEVSLNGTGLAYSVQTVSANITLGPQNLVLVDSSSDNIELTLPKANTCEGRVYTVKKISAENHVTINADNFKTTIDGAHQYKLAGNDLPQMGLVSDGNKWFVTSERGTDIKAFVKFDSNVAINANHPNLNRGYFRSRCLFNPTGCIKCE